MALFEYNSLTESGRLMRGNIEAANVEQARQMLTDMKLNIQELSKVEPKFTIKTFGPGEFLLFNQQLESITKAAIPLEKGLRALAAEAGSPRMQILLNDIASELEAGVPIEQAIEKRQKQFPPLYGMMLRAGIKTGRLSEMLACLNRHLEIVHRTRRIIMESVLYPAVILSLAAMIISNVLIFIIPTFSAVLSDMSDGKAHLPVLTRFILFISHYVLHFWAAVAAVIGAALILWFGLSKTAGGRRIRESFIRSIPLLGRIYKNGILARLSEAMAMLIDSGCPLPESFRLAAEASGSEKTMYDSVLLAEQLEKGYPVIEAGAVCRTLPPLMLYSIQLGGQRNCLKENLLELGRMYAQQTFGMQARLQTILMPLMIIGTGLIIGTIITAMFLPMVSIVKTLM
ncbi:MAG: type II secretion system F family protein [Planctomycetes bacterium]|nr:type II secretion system F family protein [Planctomycetota bacterium]